MIAVIFLTNDAGPKIRCKKPLKCVWEDGSKIDVHYERVTTLTLSHCV